MRTTLLRGLLALSALVAANDASAISCAEIMNMVNVGVPANIVGQTMEQSGTRFTATDIQCLVEKKAPTELITIASRMASAASAPVEETPPVRTPPPAEEEEAPAFDRSEGLGNNINVEEIEEGGEQGPAKLEELVELYRAKKVLTASKGLYDLLQDPQYTDYQDKIHYYLAKSLYDLGMYHGAQHHFMQVVRKGPQNPYFKYALPKLVAIARINGNDIELLRIVKKIPPEAFPQQAQNHLNYLMGRKLYEEGDLAGASRYFQQVSTKSDLFLKARYFDGVINVERQKYKSAVKSFRDVYQSEVAPTDVRSLQEYEDLKDLALINVARVYFQLDRFEQADEFYGLVDRDSTYWAESLFERSWTKFWMSDLNSSLGLLLTVYSPYYSETQFLPESTILRALSYFQFCEHDDADRILLEFERTYGPAKAEMKAFLEQYKSEEAKKTAELAYDAYFTNPHTDSKIPSTLFSRILRNRDLAGMVRHMDMMDQELALIDAQKGVWQDSVGTHLREVIEEDRVRYKRRAGQVFLQEMAWQYSVLSDLTSQSELIRFEIVDAQRLDYQYKASNLQVESQEDKVVDFAVSKEIIYWPFNGEFWQDELGYYKYTEQSQCK